MGAKPPLTAATWRRRKATRFTWKRPLPWRVRPHHLQDLTMIDPAAIGIVSSSLGTAINMAKALSGIRDAALLAERTAALNDELLKTQEALLRHNAGMFELQTQYFEACEELRKLKEAVAEKERYPLVDLGLSVFAHRVDVPPDQSGTSAPGTTETTYYLCQPCLDLGRKSVLQVSTYRAFCSVCKRDAQIKPIPAPPPVRYTSAVRGRY